MVTGQIRCWSLCSFCPTRENLLPIKPVIPASETRLPMPSGRERMHHSLGFHARLLTVNGDVALALVAPVEIAFSHDALLQDLRDNPLVREITHVSEPRTLAVTASEHSAVEAIRKGRLRRLSFNVDQEWVESVGLRISGRNSSVLFHSSFSHQSFPCTARQLLLLP